MGDKISVIVPVYNVEEYLGRCLDSVCGQTYQNLEIILIDDGSTDSSPDICDEYAGKDGRIRVIHRENGGIACVRNHGIELATGKYIVWCDSDDWMATDTIEYLYTNLKAANVRLAFCGFYKVRGDKKYIYASDKDMVLDSVEGLNELMDFKNQGGIQGQSWGQLIEKSVLENVRYPQGCIYEDTLTEYKVIESAGKMVVLHEAKYYYVQRSGSITHGDVERVNLGICYANEARYIDLVSRRPELKDNVLHRYLYNFTKLARDGVSEKNMKEFLERREFFRSVYDDLRANPYMKWMEKLELPLLYKSDGKKSVCLWILEMFRMTARIPWMLREQRSRRGSAL